MVKNMGGQQQQQHGRTFEQYGFSFFIIDNAFQFTLMLQFINKEKIKSEVDFALYFALFYFMTHITICLTV